jgi:Na+-transporting NADH:ubiquinone oxidoreductase subunit A
MDTNPLAPPPAVWIKEHAAHFALGVEILSKLTKGAVYLCKAPELKIEANWPSAKNIEVCTFDGPHPAGLTGTHINFLSGASARKMVWSINYQEVIAVGHLFATGKLMVERLVTLAGPQALKPRLLITNLGADLVELAKGEVAEGETRLVSGSPFFGRKAAPGPTSFLGRFSYQLTLLKEEREREFLGWQAPGFNKFSILRTFAAKFIPGKKFDLGTSQNGSHRAIVPVGAFERVMPQDYLPTLLLKSILSQDTDTAQSLGCLELDEEDLSLCTFVDPGKTDFGPKLREVLNLIEKEG